MEGFSKRYLVYYTCVYVPISIFSFGIIFFIVKLHSNPFQFIEYIFWILIFGLLIVILILKIKHFYFSLNKDHIFVREYNDNKINKIPLKLVKKVMLNQSILDRHCHTASLRFLLKDLIQEPKEVNLFGIKTPVIPRFFKGRYFPGPRISGDEIIVESLTIDDARAILHRIAGD